MNSATDVRAITGATGPIAASTERTISWAAIAGGAVAATALSLLLLALGAGLGLSSISPWSYEGASVKTIGIAGAAWLLLMSAVASGLGGYLAGRLRGQWLEVDAEEAFFRDTAHGFLAWALATVISAAVLTSAASSMVGTAAKAAAGMGAATAGSIAAGGTVAVANAPESTRDYYVDMMFRGAKPAEAGVDVADIRREAGNIVANALSGGPSQPDRAYLAQMVAQRAGLTPAEAEQRVTQTMNSAKAAADQAATKAREAADAARKATAHVALWVFVSLLLGAFAAALAATWGGRQRDVLAYSRTSV